MLRCLGMPRRSNTSRQLVLAVASRTADLKLAESVLRQKVDLELTTTSEDAFSILRKRRVDALVATYDLPGTDINDFLETAGSIQSGVGRVLIVPRRQLPAILPALQRGVATSFVMEPFMPQELWVAVRRALRTQPLRLLLVTRDPGFSRRVAPLFLENGVDCTETETMADTDRRLIGASWDVCLVDVDLGEKSGLDLLSEIRTRSPETRVLLCGDYELPQLASDLRRLGAFDYLTKGVSDEQLLFRLRCAFEDRAWADETKPAAAEEAGLDPIIGSSARMEKLRNLVATVAQSTAPVLIRGETGTGKELVARHIHALSTRKRGRFFAVNCAALTETLFESEMFGHERGAFTGANTTKPGMCEMADDGTLFLDEIGELAALSQAKLLRFLQSGEFIRVGGQRVQRSDARILAATNSPLEQMIQDGSFRPDLFYRLNILQIQIPALNERREDTPELISHLIKRICQKHARSIVRLAPRAFEKLLAHNFAGNVRELQAVLERSILLTPSSIIEDVLLGSTEPPADSGAAAISVDVDRPLREAVDTAQRLVEREYLERVLAACGGNVILAAKRADVERRNFYRKLQDYGLNPDVFRNKREPKS